MLGWLRQIEGDWIHGYLPVDLCPTYSDGRRVHADSNHAFGSFYLIFRQSRFTVDELVADIAKLGRNLFDEQEAMSRFGREYGVASATTAIPHPLTRVEPSLAHLIGGGGRRGRTATSHMHQSSSASMLQPSTSNSPSVARPVITDNSLARLIAINVKKSAPTTADFNATNLNQNGPNSCTLGFW